MCDLPARIEMATRKLGLGVADAAAHDALGFCDDLDIEDFNRACFHTVGTGNYRAAFCGWSGRMRNIANRCAAIVCRWDAALRSR